jgi:hypothetical protein
MISFTESARPAEQDRSAAGADPQISGHPVQEPEPETKPHPSRWLTIALGLLALAAVGGLIPFWLWVYFQLN